jgi:GT2 family glycosyltransferase
MTAPLLIAAIVLHFNGVADTRRALRSLSAIGDIPMLIVAIDNGSDIDDTPALKMDFPNAHIVRLEQNLGFARGVNYAAQIALRAGASHLLLFNSDAWMHDQGATLQRLIDELSTDDRIIATGPIVINDDPRGSIQSAGYRYSLWWPIPRAIRSFGKPSFISGSCLLIVAARFAELGGLDPDLFLYGEDLDFALRSRRLGYRQTVVREASVIHRRGGSSKVLSNRYVYTALRGNLVVALKHAKWYQAPSAALAFIVISFALWLFALRAGNRGAHRAILKAWYDFFRGRWGGLDGYVLTPAERPSLRDVAQRAA